MHPRITPGPGSPPIPQPWVRAPAIPAVSASRRRAAAGSWRSVPVSLRLGHRQRFASAPHAGRGRSRSSRCAHLPVARGQCAARLRSGPSPEGPIPARGDVFEHWPVRDDCTVIGDGDPHAGHGMQDTAPLLQGIPGGVEPPAGGLADLRLLPVAQDLERVPDPRRGWCARKVRRRWAKRAPHLVGDVFEFIAAQWGSTIRSGLARPWAVLRAGIIAE